MNTKFFNDAVIGNKNIKATFSDRGEMLRTYYPNVDYKQFVDTFQVGLKINDSAIVYLHEDINNKYNQYYTENTNILNTEIENTYFNLKTKQTDFVTIKNSILVKKYTFTNNNKIDLDLKLLARIKLLSNSNNMVSAKVIEKENQQLEVNIQNSLNLSNIEKAAKENSGIKKIMWNLPANK